MCDADPAGTDASRGTAAYNGRHRAWSEAGPAFHCGRVSYATAAPSRGGVVEGGPLAPRLGTFAAPPTAPPASPCSLIVSPLCAPGCWRKGGRPPGRLLRVIPSAYNFCVGDDTADAATAATTFTAEQCCGAASTSVLRAMTQASIGNPIVGITDSLCVAVRCRACDPVEHNEARDPNPGTVGRHSPHSQCVAHRNTTRLRVAPALTEVRPTTVAGRASTSPEVLAPDNRGTDPLHCPHAGVATLPPENADNPVSCTLTGLSLTKRPLQDSNLGPPD